MKRLLAIVIFAGTVFAQTDSIPLPDAERLRVQALYRQAADLDKQIALTQIALTSLQEQRDHLFSDEIPAIISQFARSKELSAKEWQFSPQTFQFEKVKKPSGGTP